VGRPDYDDATAGESEEDEGEATDLEVLIGYGFFT
jgi:hypothetical protein